MTTKIKAKSRILEAVHETASDLHRLGFIDKRKMRKFDALCLDPVPETVPSPFAGERSEGATRMGVGTVGYAWLVYSGSLSSRHPMRWRYKLAM